MLLFIVTSCPVHVVCLSSSLNEVLLARHAIFLGNHMYKKIGASRHVFTNCWDRFCILSTENSFFSKFKMK